MDNAYRSAEALTRWVKYFLYLQIIISVIALASGYLEYQLLTDYANGTYTSRDQAIADGEANDARQSLIGIVQMAIFIVSGILILRWIHRANFNARQLGAEGMRFTPAWSVGWYFIPIASLWKPYQAMKEIWQASHAPHDWSGVETTSLLPAWWTLFIVSSALGNLAFRLTLRAEEIDEFLNANLATLLSDVSSIPLALVTLALVTRIQDTQRHAQQNSGAALAPAG